MLNSKHFPAPSENGIDEEFLYQLKVGINKADRPKHGIIMDAITIQIISAVAILGFLWNLHRDVSNLRKEVGRDMADLRQEVGQDVADLRQEVGRDIADLRERMARMEGLLEGFVGRPQELRS